MSLSRLALRTRIYGGFSVLVLLGLALTVFGCWQLSSIKDDVHRMTKLSDGMVRVLQIGQAIEIIHRAAVAYIVAGNEEPLRDASNAAAKAAELLQSAAQATTSSERRHAYNDLQTSLRVCPKSLSRITELSQHKPDGGQSKESQCIAVEILKIFGKAPAAIEPGNCALDDPAFWEDHEPFGMIRAFDDFGFEAGEDLGKIGIEKRALIRAVGEQFLQEWEHSKQRG